MAPGTPIGRRQVSNQASKTTFCKHEMCNTGTRQIHWFACKRLSTLQFLLKAFFAVSVNKKEHTNLKDNHVVYEVIES